MQSKLSFIFLSVFLMLFISVGFATPTQIGTFSTGTVITFDEIVGNNLVTTQYSPQGVIFSGAIYGMKGSGDLACFPNPGSSLAGNYVSGLMGTSFTATLSNTYTKVGFWSETNPTDNVTVELFYNATSRGSFTFVNTNGLTADFLGLQELAGFNRVMISVAGANNRFLAINDFRFDGMQSSVPEPGTWMLLSLAGLLGFWYKKQ